MSQDRQVIDVTAHVRHRGYFHGDFLPLEQCVCGRREEGGYHNIPREGAEPRQMPCCGRLLVHRVRIDVLEVEP